MKIEGTATIGIKGQIVIPKNVRDKFNLDVGDDLVVLSSKRGIMLVKSENLKDMISSFEEIVDSEENN